MDSTEKTLLQTCLTPSVLERFKIGPEIAALYNETSVQDVMSPQWVTDDQQDELCVKLGRVMHRALLDAIRHEKLDTQFKTLSSSGMILNHTPQSLTSSAIMPLPNTMSHWLVKTVVRLCTISSYETREALFLDVKKFKPDLFGAYSPSHLEAMFLRLQTEDYPNANDVNLPSAHQASALSPSFSVTGRYTKHKRGSTRIDGILKKLVSELLDDATFCESCRNLTAFFQELKRRNAHLLENYDENYLKNRCRDIARPLYQRACNLRTNQMEAYYNKLIECVIHVCSTGQRFKNAMRVFRHIKESYSQIFEDKWVESMYNSFFYLLRNSESPSLSRAVQLLHQVVDRPLPNYGNAQLEDFGDAEEEEDENQPPPAKRVQHHPLEYEPLPEE